MISSWPAKLPNPGDSTLRRERSRGPASWSTHLYLSSLPEKDDDGRLEMSVYQEVDALICCSLHLFK